MSSVCSAKSIRYGGSTVEVAPANVNSRVPAEESDSYGNQIRKFYVAGIKQERNPHPDLL